MTANHEDHGCIDSERRQPGLAHKIQTAKRILRENDLGGLLRFLLGRTEVWVVFMADVLTYSGSEPKRDLCFRQLKSKEFSLLQAPQELREEQLRRAQEQGFSRAYGVFSGQALGHVSWLYLRGEEPVSHINLARDEAEISGCVTVPDFRGKGLYPYAISCLMTEARGMGIRRVYMKTSLSNIASQRGIEKAGLRPVGKIYEWYLEYAPVRLIIRGHRWRERMGMIG